LSVVNYIVLAVFLVGLITCCHRNIHLCLRSVRSLRCLWLCLYGGSCNKPNASNARSNIERPTYFVKRKNVQFYKWLTVPL